MVYGELSDEVLERFTQLQFGLTPSSIPSTVVITPSKIENYFQNFKKVIMEKGLRIERVKGNFIVGKDSRKVLFCEGGVGSSNFTDSSILLCHCKNMEEIIFVGTGGGIGEDMESGDINLPTSCIRLDKVLEVMLPLEAPAKADLDLVKTIGQLVEKETQDIGVRIYEGVNATVPFFLSETEQLLIDLRNQGALSIDMELSVLYALANHYHKKVVGIIRIGDLPLDGLPTWKSRQYKPELKSEVHNRILNAVLNYVFTREL